MKNRKFLVILKIFLNFFTLLNVIDGQESSLTGYFKLNLSNFQLDNYLQKSLELLRKGLENQCTDKKPATPEARQYSQYNMATFAQPSEKFVLIQPKPFKLQDQLAWEDATQPLAAPTSATETTLGTVRRPSPQKKKKQRQRRKRKRNKTKKKQGGDKNKRKKQRQKKKLAQQQHVGLVGQTAHVIFATVTTEKPHFPTPIAAKPTTTAMPHYKKKIKYILRKHNSLKKVKKEYLSHLGFVIYPFVKFIAFFTVLNPFTFGVFFFSLISPIIFGILGFLALSFFVRPALHLLFDVKRRVGAINRRKWHEKRRRERLRDSRRPITIHKHYYQQHNNGAPTRLIHRNSVDEIDRRTVFNPMLPHLRDRYEHQASNWHGIAQTSRLPLRTFDNKPQSNSIISHSYKEPPFS